MYIQIQRWPNVGPTLGIAWHGLARNLSHLDLGIMLHSKNKFKSNPSLTIERPIFEGVEAGLPTDSTRCHKDRSFEIIFLLSFRSIAPSQRENPSRASQFPVACRVFDEKPEQLYPTHTRCSTQCCSELEALIVKNQKTKPKKLTRTACERKPTTRIGSLRPLSSEKGCIPLVHF